MTSIRLGIQLALSLVALSLSSCITASGTVGKPTALEHQLLGAYERLDEDLVRSSSVRAGGDLSSESFDGLKTRALELRSVQRFNEDDLLELKNEKCVAESLKATVLSLSCDLLKRDPAAKRRVARVVREENGARKAILTWAAYELARRDGRAAPTVEELSEIERAYQRLLRDVSAPGHLVETSKGKFRALGSE